MEDSMAGQTDRQTDRQELGVQWTQLQERAEFGLFITWTSTQTNNQTDTRTPVPPTTPTTPTTPTCPRRAMRTPQSVRLSVPPHPPARGGMIGACSLIQCDPISAGLCRKLRNHPVLPYIPQHIPAPAGGRGVHSPPGIVPVP